MAIPRDIPVPDMADQEDGIQPASVVSKTARGVTRELIQPLTKPGARISPRSKVVEAVEAPAVGEMPLGPRIELAPEAEAPQPVKPAPVSEAELETLAAAREAEIGTPREVPSPSAAQLEAGLVKGPVNTRFYDDDGLAATIQATAKAVDDGALIAIKPRTIGEIYDAAIEAGTPKENLDAIFGGQPMSTPIGNDQLNQRMAGLVLLERASAERVDEYLRLAARNELDDAGKLEAREAIAQHNVIMAELAGAKTDIARSMNVFKGIQGQRAGVSINEMRAALDNLGGDDQLRLLAETYNSTNSKAARNALLRNSVRRKAYESMVYMAQSVMLNDYTTHMYNAAGNALMQFLDVPERMGAVAVAPLRKGLEALVGKANPDQYYGADIYARLSGIRNGLVDGWGMMGRKFVEAGAAKDAPRDPLRAEYWAGAPYRIPFTKQIREFPDLTDTALGKAFNGMGLVYSLPFRALGAADEFFAGVAQRVQLHEEAARLGGEVFDQTFADLIARGAEEKTAHAQAIEAGQRAVQKLLSERPADVEASVQAWRKQATLQDDLDRELPMAGIYAGANKLMNKWYIKPLAPFSKTLTNIANEGAARSGPLALLSARFWSDWQKGGRHRDLAISRLALGGAMIWAGYEVAGRGRVTGAGPGDTGQRNDLKSRGWREFSLRVGKDEVPSDLVSQLREIIGEENFGDGTGEDFGDSYFIPLNRLEPANMPFLMGAAIADAVKYDGYDPDNTMFDTAFSAGMAGVSEYATSIPTMQTFSEMMAIAGYRQETAGDRGMKIWNAFVKRYSSFYINAIPIAGMSNSTMASRIERAIDPTVRDVGVGDEYHPALAGFGEAMNRWRSRIPYYSTGLPAKLDKWGNEIGMSENSAWIPLTVSKGESNEVLEFLDAIQYSPPEVPRAIDGVKIPSDIKKRFAELYSKQIMIDGMSLEENIKSTMGEMMEEYKVEGIYGSDVPIGDMRSMVANIVGQYRKIAKARMFGAIQEDPMNPGRYEYSLTPEDLSDYGLDDMRIEFPAFAEMLAIAKNKKRYPRLAAPAKPTLQGILD